MRSFVSITRSCILAALALNAPAASAQGNQCTGKTGPFLEQCQAMHAEVEARSRWNKAHKGTTSVGRSAPTQGLPSFTDDSNSASRPTTFEVCSGKTGAFRQRCEAMHEEARLRSAKNHEENDGGQ